MEKVDIKTISNSVAQVAYKGRCMGCSACTSVCPKKAISLCENQDGFLQPYVDKEKCVNCGICLVKCISEHPVYKNNPRPICYAMMADDNIRKISSSGGMFTVAAEYVLEKGGYVCGAAYRDDFTVEHIIISDKNEMDRLRGSKYMQSHMGTIYEDVKKILNKGATVLFTGMPCQVAGLYASLGKKYENLYTIDLFCHGITSSKVFQKYHHDVLGDKPMKRLEFKEKEPWGWHAGINAYFQDGSKYSVPLERDMFFKAYLNSIAKNTSCATCTANRLPRQGDMTIGDFWGIDKNDPEMHDGKGTSAVLVNSEKGVSFFEVLKESMKSWREESLDVAINGNRSIQAPYGLHKNRSAFFKKINALDFTSLTMGCFNNRVYEMERKLLKSLPDSDYDLYYLAKAASENSGDRKIIAWTKSPRFETILKKYFDRKVYFSIVKNPAGVDNKTVFPLAKIQGRASEYYVVGIHPGADMCREMERFEYREVTDYIFRTPRPIVIERFDCATGRYEDAYGNTIEGGAGVIGRVVFRGGNNHIVLGNRIRHVENLNFDLEANCYIEIGDECSFNAINRFIVMGRNGNSEIKIRERCRFTDALTRVYNSEFTTSILINDSCTFEMKLELHANAGKKIIVGRDCMFSHDVELWAGDGHSIFDVVTRKNVNSVYNDMPQDKNLLVIGNHVWIGKGAFIMHGTNIGDGSIVGARSTVKGIYPNNCTIHGNPSKVAKKDIAWSREQVTSDISKCGRSEYVAATSNAKPPISGRKVLVIGGTRFMGIHLVRELIALGNDVTIANRGRAHDDFGLDVKRLIMDVSDRESCQRALGGKYFDVVFDNLAYCSKYVDNVLGNVQCKRYVQLSSVEAYKSLDIDMKEERFDPYNITMNICPASVGYVEGKRQAEAIVYQKYKGVSAVTVRIPYVTPTDRLYYYCRNMVNATPMRIKDVSHAFTFIRAHEVGEFLPWIAAQDFTGPINLASSGRVSIQMILEYIEKRTKSVPVISQDEALPKEPFTVYNENRYSMNMDKAALLGWRVSNLHDWLWDYMDENIKRAVKKKF